MRIKDLFLVVVLLLLVGSVNALNYNNFESKGEFTTFLEQANILKLDLRNDYSTSRSIKEQAHKFGVDLKYYEELQLYDSIFSKFSWLLTGFAIGTLPGEMTEISPSQTIVVPGQKITILLTNLDYLEEEKVAITIEENIVAIFPKDDQKEITFEITIPELEPGKYKINIEGTEIEVGFEIKEVTSEDPILKLNINEIKPGEILTISGVNIPPSENSELRISANEEILAILVYPTQGVFKQEMQIDLAPGIYIISLEDMETAFAKLIVKLPYQEPKIELSANLVEKEDKLIIFGKNFREEITELLLYGPTESVIENIIIDKNGEFERFLETSDLEIGEYKIFSEKYNTVEAVFKIKEIEEDLPVLQTDLISVEQGKTITVIGSRFEETRIIIILDDKEINVLCTKQGRFSKPIDTSNLFIGSHKIYWKDNPSVLVPFNVKKRKPEPKIFLDDVKIYVGELFKVYGENFFDASFVNFYVEDSYVGRVEVNRNGEFSTSLTSNAGVGAHKLIVKNEKGEILAITALNLEEKIFPVMKVLTEQIYSQGEFKLKGFFFETGKVEIKINEQVLKIIEVDKNGDFEEIISLENLKIIPGSYKLIAEQNNEIKTITAINILEEKPAPVVKIINEVVYETDILHLVGMYFEEDKIIIQIGDIFKDVILISESGTFNYQINLEEMGIGPGSYKLNVGDVFTPLNVNSVEGPILKVSPSEIFLGEKVIISGEGFDDTESLILIIDDSFSYEINSGKFQIIINTKEIGAGLHKVRVQGYEVTSSFDVKELSSDKPILRVLPQEIFFGDIITTYGFNFDEAQESIIVTIDGSNLQTMPGGETSNTNDLTYTIYPVGGNFELTFNSKKLDIGYYEITSEEITTSFMINEKINPIITVLNPTVIQGQDITLVGENFKSINSGVVEQLIIDKVYYGPVIPSEGSFKTQIQTENLAVGYHQVEIESYEVIAGFTIESKVVKKPDIRLSHQSATTGMMVSIVGSNFPKSPQETLTINLEGDYVELDEGKELLKIAYPNEGSIATSFLVPQLDIGEYFVSVKGFSTAVDSFIYKESGSTEPEMILFEQEARVGDLIGGVVNNLPMGVVMNIEIILNGVKVGELLSSGIGSALFNFYVPDINPGKYGVGLVGISPDMTRLEVLADPEITPSKIYTEEEIVAIQQEVLEHVLGITEEKTEDEVQIAEIQQRVLFGFVDDLVSEDCVADCGSESCGQRSGCGKRCSANDIDIAGKCGNPVVSDTPFGKTADKLSEKTTNILARFLFLE